MDLPTEDMITNWNEHNEHTDNAVPDQSIVVDGPALYDIHNRICRTLSDPAADRQDALELAADQLAVLLGLGGAELALEDVDPQYVADYDRDAGRDLDDD